MSQYRLRKTGLGLIASGRRKILPGTAYENYFPRTVGTDPVIDEEGTVYNTIEYCAKIVKRTLHHTRLIARLIALAHPPEKDLNATCRAVFLFFYLHYQYELDQDGVEQLRDPARAWKDRKKGIDCDCFCISVSSVLVNLKIPHYLKMVKLYGRDYYQHIYVVVPKTPNTNINQRSNYYVIDPVLDQYDKEAPKINKSYTKKMSMPIQYLNGTDTVRLGNEFNGLGDGLGATDATGLYKDFNRRMKLHLRNTRNEIARNPGKVKRFFKPQQLVGMYDHLLKNWDDEQARDKALQGLCKVEETALKDSLRGLGDIVNGTDDEMFALLNGDFETDGLEGLAGKKAKARKAAKKAAAPTKKKGVFTKIKNAVNKAKTAVKKVGAKAKETLKKIGKAVVKNNPLSLAARGGFLLAMKTNFGRLASRAYWGYFSEAEAKKAGVTSSYWNKSKQALAQIEKVFVQKLKGTSDALKKAIITGRAAKKVAKLSGKGKLSGLDYIEGVNVVNGLGVVAAATITAALTFLTPLVKLFSGIFTKPGGKEETEEGGETTPQPTDDQTSMTQTDPGFTVSDDNSAEHYETQVNNAPVNEDDSSGSSDYSDYSSMSEKKTTSDSGNSTTTPTQPTTRSATTNTGTTPQDVTNETSQDEQPDTENKKPGGTIAVLGLSALALLLLAKGGKKKKQNLEGVKKIKVK